MSQEKSEEVVILSAVRTPIGSFCGSLSSFQAHELGAKCISAAVKRAEVNPDKVSEVIFGQALTAGHGQNPARQAAVLGGLPYSVPSTTVNMLCGSGLRSVLMAAQAIKAGDSSIVVAGGQESMSQAHHSVHLRSGVKMGNKTLTDTMLSDGLTDAFHNVHMGITAENIAVKYSVDRVQQDEFAFASQQKARVALDSGDFKDEIVPIEVKERTGIVTVAVDEYPKNTSLESLSKLRPVFITDGSGTVTAGNASGLNDGAAAIVLSSMTFAQNLGIKPLARVVGYACSGVDPLIMGMGPVSAIQEALKKVRWTIESVDLYELNEAFAAQSLAVIKELNLNREKVNISGGAIALGHPIGASGARVLVTLIHALKRTSGRRGVAALCVGGGMGIAICVEMM